MPFPFVDEDTLADLIGKIIAFGGTGFLNHLKHLGQSDCYYLVGVDDEMLSLKSVSTGKEWFLKSKYWEQPCMIVDSDEYEMLGLLEMLDGPLVCNF
jgi:hypothetical protein